MGRLQPEASDEVLAARIAAGDRGAFASLYDRYAPRLHAWAAHALGGVEADDAVQEVFVRVWRKSWQFDATRGRFASWLLAVARHHLIRELMKRRRQLVAAEEIERVLANAVDPGRDVEDEVWLRDRERVVLAALRAIPEEQRRVLVLAYFVGMTQSQMARQLGIPLGTVKKRVRLGMQKLRASLAADASEQPRLRVVADE